MAACLDADTFPAARKAASICAVRDDSIRISAQRDRLYGQTPEVLIRPATIADAYLLARSLRAACPQPQRQDLIGLCTFQSMPITTYLQPATSRLSACSGRRLKEFQHQASSGRAALR
jgi:hypothetical protein